MKLMSFETMKRHIITLLIILLYSALIFSIVDLFVQAPNYSDYCNNSFPQLINQNCTQVNPEEGLVSDCSNQGGIIEPVYEGGCVVSYKCNYCSKSYDDAMSAFSFKRFMISTILGVISIILFLNLNSEKEVINSIYLGFMTGGLISVLIGTIGYFNYMSSALRVITMVAEIGLVTWVGLKTSN